MKRLLWITGITAGVAVFWLMAQSSGDPLIQGYRETEVATVADAMEHQQVFMSHEMRPLEKVKFAGPAWTGTDSGQPAWRPCILLLCDPGECHEDCSCDQVW